MVLTPLGGLINTTCKGTPSDFCSKIGPSLFNFQNLVDLLTGRTR
jgi:hypothetical protein